MINLSKLSILLRGAQKLHHPWQKGDNEVKGLKRVSLMPVFKLKMRLKHSPKIIKITPIFNETAHFVSRVFSSV